MKWYNFGIPDREVGWRIKYYLLQADLWVVGFEDAAQAVAASSLTPTLTSLDTDPSLTRKLLQCIDAGDGRVAVVLRYCDQCHDYNPRIGACTTGAGCRKRAQKDNKGRKKRRKDTDALQSTAKRRDVPVGVPAAGALSPNPPSAFGAPQGNQPHHLNHQLNTPHTPPHYEMSVNQAEYQQQQQQQQQQQPPFNGLQSQASFNPLFSLREQQQSLFAQPLGHPASGLVVQGVLLADAQGPRPAGSQASDQRPADFLSVAVTPPTPPTFQGQGNPPNAGNWMGVEGVVSPGVSPSYNYGGQGGSSPYSPYSQYSDQSSPIPAAYSSPPPMSPDRGGGLQAGGDGPLYGFSGSGIAGDWTLDAMEVLDDFGLGLESPLDDWDEDIYGAENGGILVDTFFKAESEGPFAHNLEKGRPDRRRSASSSTGERRSGSVDMSREVQMTVVNAAPTRLDGVVGAANRDNAKAVVDGPLEGDDPDDPPHDPDTHEVDSDPESQAGQAGQAGRHAGQAGHNPRFLDRVGEAPPKSQRVARALWASPLGWVGAHHFYLGRPKWGFLFLFTLGLVGIGWLMDGFRLAALVRRVNAENRPRAEGEERETGDPLQLAEAFMLCFPLGLFGFHHFYLRRYKMGLLYLCTFGLLGMGVVADAVRLRRLVREANHRIRSQQGLQARLYNHRHRLKLLRLHHRLAPRPSLLHEGDLDSGLAYVLALPPWGVFGCHHIYLGRRWLAPLYACTLGFFGVGLLIDLCAMPFLVNTARRREIRRWRRKLSLFKLEEEKIHSRRIQAAKAAGEGQGQASEALFHDLAYHASYKKLAWAEEEEAGQRGRERGAGEECDGPNVFLEEDRVFEMFIAYRLLCSPIGLMGAHQWYLGRPRVGLLYPPTLGLLLVGWLTDFCRLPDLVKQHRERRLQKQRGIQLGYDFTWLHRGPFDQKQARILWLPPLGCLGCHRCYLGQWRAGCRMVVTLGCCCIRWCVDGVDLAQDVARANRAERLPLGMQTSTASSSQSAVHVSV